MKAQTEVALGGLRAGGALERADAGHVAAWRTLAEQIDAEVRAGEPSRFVIATLMGRYLETARDLRGTRIPADDSFERALAEITAEIRHLPDT